MKTATQTQTDREFVISHVDYRLEEKDQKLTGSQLWSLYCMADGFGNRTPAELRQLNGGYDWSHFRDSSDGAFRQMATMIRYWLGDAEREESRFKTLAQVRSEAIRSLQTAQTRFLDNPSAENFALTAQAMLDYQQIIKT